MKRRTLIATLMMPLGIARGQPRTAWLVTPEEALRFKGAEGFDDPPPLRARAVMPYIEVLQPSADTGAQKLKAPFPIAVRFHAADAPIVASTFRVLYGGLHIDITERIVQYVKPTIEGFSFEHAQIPSGRHRLILSVTDEKQRTAQSELRFEVE